MLISDGLGGVCTVYVQHKSRKNAAGYSAVAIDLECVAMQYVLCSLVSVRLLSFYFGGPKVFRFLAKEIVAICE